VHEATEDEHEAISKLRSIPLASRTLSANSKLSFATANTDFLANGSRVYLQPTAY
jgi:hypothetical protein